MKAENKDQRSTQTIETNCDPESRSAEKEPDAFDRFMSKPAFTKIYPFYEKHKEFILYAFFGIGTVICSVGSFALFETVMGMNELIANALSWIFAVAFAFVTNKLWVFESGQNDLKGWLKEGAEFTGGRLITLGLEELILYIFITRMDLPSIPVKLAAQVIVIACNYVFSKLWVFKK